MVSGTRKSGKQTPIANPKGNWWEKTTKEYGATVKYDMAEFLDKGMKRASAKAYAKSLAGVKRLIMAKSKHTLSQLSH